MLARDVMTTAVLAVRPETAVPEIAELLLECRISAVPVIDARDRVCGIVSEGDLINRADGGTRHRRSWWLEMLSSPEERSREFLRAHGQRAEDVMTRDVVAAAEDTPLPEIAAMLEKHRVKRVPVLRDGKLVGLVSRSNLLQGLALGLPEGALPENDRELRETLCKALNEAGLPMHQLNVTVNAGNVRLWGWVDAEVQRQAARSAAESTPGVAGIEDNLIVTPPALRAGRGYI